MTDAASQHQGQRKCDVGAGEELVDRGAEDFGKTHPAVFGVGQQADPTAFGDGLVGAVETLGEGHFAIRPLGADLVADLVAGRELLGCDLERLVEDHFDVLQVPVGKLLRFEQLGGWEPLEELELDVTKIDFVVHERPPWAT